jgi:aspartate aminotransferase-like enzyme
MTQNGGDTMRRDPFLLTPGPLTTSRSTKEAMLHDWGSRDGEFIDRLSRRGFVIYPGKLTVADSFRIGCIGCIGRLGEAEMRGALDAIRDILVEMGVTRCAPAAAEPAGARLPRTI